jgi:hypothetical protein
MNKSLIAVIVFVVSTGIVLGLLQFVVHVQGAVLKLAVGIIVGLIAAGIAFLVVQVPGKG